MSSDRTTIEIFFDGECPLCTREIAMVRRLDRNQRIRFTDIAAPGFEPEAIGTTRGALMERIRARLPDGTWIEGVEVFRRMYAAVGFGAFVPLTRLPRVSHALDLGYERFAKNRLRWTGRCTPDGLCQVHPTAHAGART
jgi:predicted DCC family thiol-disulfide oxidoreductase YuxK